jgi:NADPH-dependent 2,4-dienoyl-CoA reductase/sulfur reductase-like enzyme
LKTVDLAVLGAGPAGLCAAIEGARHGLETTLIDENSRPGGQLFKQIHKFFGSEAHWAGNRGVNIGARLLEETAKAGVRVMLDTVAWGLFPDNTIALVNRGAGSQLKARSIILATGASENALAFPGWTLPGVMGAGGAQTLINLHRVIPGGKAVMIGSGNVGLIVGYQLIQAGIELEAVVEAAGKIGGYTVHASKLARCGVEILTSTTIKEVRGKEKVNAAITVSVDEQWNHINGTERKFDVDMVCLAVGLSPLIELAQMAGCRMEYVSELGGFVPVHDRKMKTTAPGIYTAGDIAGIDEASTAMEEGRIAALSAAESLGRLDANKAETLRAEARKRMESFWDGSFGRRIKLAKENLTVKE